jgi:hypothetical protein
MRYWLSFRGPFGTRPGISVSGAEIAKWGRRPPTANAETLLGIFARADNAIFLAAYNRNGANEHLADVKPVAVFVLPSAGAVEDVRDGALIRLAKHIDKDGLIIGQSLGQCCAAVRNEASTLGLPARFVRVQTTPANATERTEDWAETPTAKAIGLIAFLACVLFIVARGLG